MVTTERKAEVVKQFGGAAQNTGTVEVQIALLTERIKDLSTHFEKNKKDHSSMRGLMKLIGQRRSLLKHLSQKDQTRYTKLISELGIRK